MKIELVSKQFHKFGGKLRKKGEHIFATPAEARALVALGRAVAVDAEQVAPATPEVRTKRAYKRRDMQAEAPAVIVTTEPEPEPARSFVDEVARVKDEFRAARAVHAAWELRKPDEGVIPPKKDAAE